MVGSKTIACVNCGGTGHVYKLAYDGMKYPVTCKGCNGSGMQKVRG